MNDLLYFNETGNTYRSAVVDECGYVVKWASDFEDKFELYEWLDSHPEHQLTCVSY